MRNGAFAPVIPGCRNKNATASELTYMAWCDCHGGQADVSRSRPRYAGNDCKYRFRFRRSDALFSHSAGAGDAKNKETIWLPAADWLLVGATLVSLLLVIVPLVTLPEVRIAAAASGAAAIMVAGYVLAILGHYRIVFGQKRSGPRHNPEPSELLFVTVALVAAFCLFVLRLAL